MNIFSMLKSVFYKERVKTASMAGILFLVNMAFMGWIFLSIRRLFALDHSEVVWYRVMNLGQIPYDAMAFLPLMTAIVFCLFQFLQEMRDARIRISLHLPCDSSTIVLFHALYGLVFLAIIFIFDALALFAISQYYFPFEFSISALETALAWFVAGLYAYLGGAFLLLEPLKKRKFLAFLITFIISMQLLIFDTASFYNAVICLFILLLLPMFYAIAISAEDYRDRWL